MTFTAKWFLGDVRSSLYIFPGFSNWIVDLYYLNNLVQSEKKKRKSFRWGIITVLSVHSMLKLWHSSDPPPIFFSLNLLRRVVLSIASIQYKINLTFYRVNGLSCYWQMSILKLFTFFISAYVLLEFLKF